MVHMGMHNRVEPWNAADNFFGSPEINEAVTIHAPKKCRAGCLAMRVPDPPKYAPPTICNISKDGKIAAIGGRDVELYLWDTTTGGLLATLRGHEICWTSSYDHTFFVTVQEDSKVFLWDQQTITQKQLLGHPDEPLTCCSVSLDDEFIVVGGAKGGVYAWDSETGAEYRQYDGGHTGPVQTVMCYAMEDGSHIIISCGAADHTITVWDLETSSQRAKVHVTELDQAKNVRYFVSKDGTQVLVWCTDAVPFPNLVFVDALNDAKNSVFCHEGFVRHAVFARDSERIISCGNDGKIVIWDTITLEPQMTLAGHNGAVLCCAINEACTHVVSSGEDCTVRLWSAEDGRQLQSMQAQNLPVKMCTFDRSFNKILACDTGGHVYVWNTLAEVILNLIRRFADSISCVSMSADQKLMAAGSVTGRVMMWDVERRELMWEHPMHAGRVECLAFNTMMEVASAGADGRISLMSMETGKQMNYFLGQDEPIMALEFSPDDERIAACSADGKLMLYLASSASHRPKLVLRSNIARVMSFVWSPNSKLIAGCCSDGCSLIWNAATGSIFTVLEGDNASSCSTFDFSGKLLAIGTVMGTTNIYNLETTELLTQLCSNASAVRSVMFNEDTTHLTTVCSRQAIVWDVANAVKVRCYDFVVDATGEFSEKPSQYRSTVAHDSTVLFDPESETIVYDMSAVEDTQLKSHFLSDTHMIQASLQHKGVMVWSAACNTSSDKFHTTHDAITSCHFNHDDRLAVMGTQDGQIIVYDVVHGEMLEVIAAHHNGPCRCVKFTKDNNEVLSAGADAKVIMWDWRKRTPTRIYSGHFISVGCCDLADNGNRVASGDNHGMISVWERDTGAVVQTMPLAHAKAVLSVSMSGDGSMVASVGADGKVAIWSVDVGLELVALTSAIESTPLYCGFSPDGNKLAITETNGNVMIWNAMVGCQWYMISNAHKGKVSGCAWSKDCRRLITCGDDSLTAIWDTESGACLHKYNAQSGPLTSVSVSPLMKYIVVGSLSGTLSVVNVGLVTREVPEPSFLYNWLASHEPQQALPQYLKLLARHPTLPNAQDSQGWSVVSHAMSKGSASVAAMILKALPEGCSSFGISSSIPYNVRTRVRFHTSDEDESNVEEMRGVLTAMSRRENSAHDSPTKVQTSRKSVLDAFNPFRGGGISSGSNDGGIGTASETALRDVLVQKSIKSFSQQVRRVAVELMTEAREVDQLELIMNNALALALNSKSSECVQVLLDAAAAQKVSQGSYHAITDMMPSLAVRYPYMCYGFLSNLSLHKVGELEVPVSVIKGIDNSIIRTAPYFTNVRELWRSYIEARSEAKVKDTGPQPYAHVEASMVRLPFACAIGSESLLHTLVSSNVPVETYGTPSVHAIIRHKWHMYGSRHMITRAVIYLFFSFIYTVWAIMYATEDHSLSLAAYWHAAARNRVHLVMSVYLLCQGLYFLWMELAQLFGTKLTLYFRSFWNALDIVSIAINLVIQPMHLARVGGAPGEWLAPLVAIGCLLIYMKIFFYGLAFEWTARLVHMMTEIAWQCKTWLLMLVLSMLSFGSSLMVLYQYVRPDDEANYSTFAMSMLMVWDLVIGSQFNLQSQLDSGSWAIVCIIIFSILMFWTQLVMLNMLIALMLDIYSMVKETELDVFMRGRAQMLIEVETLMSRKRVTEYSLLPPYVHLLKAVKRAVHAQSNTDFRLEAMEAVMREQSELIAGLGKMMGMSVLGGYGGFGGGGGGYYGPAGGMGGMGGMGGAGGGGGGADGGLGGLQVGSADLLPQASSAAGMQLMGMPAGSEPVNIIQMHAQHLKESESQLPAILRQIDRLQRTVNNQEMRMEGMVMVLRDIENLMRNQQPVIITQDAQPKPRTNLLSEAELEKEVKRLLGQDVGKGSTRL